MSNVNHIQKMSRMELKELNKLNQELIRDKMSLDEFFSDFLSKKVLNHGVTDTPEWVAYKTKFLEYQELSSLIGWSNYYIERLSLNCKGQQ
jgi:hypothetical protein